VQDESAVATVRGGDAALAEEAAQEAFVRACQQPQPLVSAHFIGMVNKQE
jgi:DNA-directed RNA polymerase specialized sigma24 family protein